MSNAAWLDNRARERVRDCIQQIESATGAEVVTTVCASSGHYRHADYLVGAMFSFGSLLFYLLYPAPLFDDVAVVIIVAFFAVGAVLSMALSPLRRLLVSRRLMDDAVRKSAMASFVEQGISKTRARTGVLVYVSLFERRVQVVADIGVPVERIGGRWTEATTSMDRAARGGVEPFAASLLELGRILAEAVPRAADDINELPDEMVKA